MGVIAATQRPTMSAELRRAKNRMSDAWTSAVQASYANMKPYVDVPYTMSLWSGSISNAYKDQWLVCERHPDGGWDWLEIRRKYNSVKDTIAVLSVDDRLSCLALFHTSRDRVLVRFLEGDPRGDCQLVGIRVTLMLDLAFTFGQRYGCKEVQLVPVNLALEKLYNDRYGFELVTHKGGDRYMRRGF